MSEKHLGLGRTSEQNLITQSIGVQSLPLASSFAHQDSGRAGVQGGRLVPGISRSPGNNTNDSISQAAISSILSVTPNHNHVSSMSGAITNAITSPSVSTSVSATITSAMSAPSRKRKLPTEEADNLKRKLSESESVRLRKLQSHFAERCAIQCYLQTQGLPSEYTSWRIRLPPVPLVNFLRINRLKYDDETEDLYCVLKSSTLVPSSLSSGRSPTSSDASTRLQSPSTLNLSVSNQASDKRLTKPLKLTLSSNRTSAQVKQDGESSPSGSQEQIVERAKQEAYVMQRIGELQRDGLWAEKRLPKVFELPRPKAHWDYLLEEMVWLAADFAQERKWKKAAAKKCARMVQKYFQEKEVNAQKAIKAKELQLRKIAGVMAKEVKQFWANIEKLVEFKQQVRLEAKRKKVLDQHLSFIVDQTEKYSSLVAESMNVSAVSSKQASPKHHSDIEFEPEEDSDDDEETIAKEEALSKCDQNAITDELSALQRESELPLDELLSDYLMHRDSIPEEPQSPSSHHSAEDSDDEAFTASDKESSDDEETIQEQEEVEGSLNHKEELNELEADNNLSIEDLKQKYNVSGGLPNPDNASIDGDSNTDIEEEQQKMDADEDSIEGENEDDEEEEEEEEIDVDYVNEPALESLFTEEKKETPEETNKEINDVAAIAQSLQPKGNTLSSTNVVTKVPFLLKHKLREYQHIGLDWLVTMYERNLNGILADEMGLGKTIQTISLLAHLACEKGNWGPHLIVVPTSVMLNWEMEFKKWCPAFKILTYYGSVKDRRIKRIGWTKPNAFHICITSYKLIIQDHQSFRRKKWKYLILDEAQNIKNFKSQRWQLLLNFQTQRRLLLTGTPLQNNLMELWSLMHFLMPSVFESHREFKEWFSNPVTGMIEGNSEYNETIIKRLHKVLRPFLLRRLKCEVETQMPKKYEHVVMCRLSNRQRYLYDDFMSRAKTRETLASGNLLSVINVLMQLRKVCNHPNLFEVRPIVSPFQMDGLVLNTSSLFTSVLDYNPFLHVGVESLGLNLVALESWLMAFVAHRALRYKSSKKLIEEIDSAPPSKPPCPKGKIKISVQRRNSSVPSSPQASNSVRPSLVQVTGGNNHRLLTVPGTKVGTSPIVKTLVGQTPNSSSNQGVTLRFAGPAGQIQNYIQLVQQPGGVKAISVAALGGSQVVKTDGPRLMPQIAQIVNTPSGKQLLLSPQQVQPTTGAATVLTGQRLTVVSKPNAGGGVTRFVGPATTTSASLINSPLRPVVRVPPLNISTPSQSLSSQNIILSSNSGTLITESPSAVGMSTVGNNCIINGISAPAASLTAATTPSPSPSKVVTRLAAANAASPDKEKPLSQRLVKDERIENIRRVRRKEKLSMIHRINDMRCKRFPIYGCDVITSLRLEDKFKSSDWRWTGSILCKNLCKKYFSKTWERTESLSNLVLTLEQRVDQLKDIFSRFVMHVPAVNAKKISMAVSHLPPWKSTMEALYETKLEEIVKPFQGLLHPISSGMATQFPDPRLIQYDCGKLQALDNLLRQLKSEHHRVLLFTQMTRMLDILEAFLNYHGHIYLRLDGTTRVEQRQILMERFNNDKRIFCFILSTRSGGVGVNLTGADTVIFYDSDWNPTMDAQAQDRCHRIGQTRDVHIYRLISEKTVEENILKKANQKRMLGDLAIEGGNFTTAYFKSSTIQDLFNIDVSENDASRRMAEVLSEKKNDDSLMVEDTKTAAAALETALAQAEDESDVKAARTATAEAAAELAEFDETIPLESQESQEQMSKAELELQGLIQQLSGIEKYAMTFVEKMEAQFAEQKLAAAEAAIEEQKRGWEASQASRERKRKGMTGDGLSEDDDVQLTYSGSDARTQEWISNRGEPMPMWCPPTPPQDDSDMYIDEALAMLYEQHVIPESQLPPVYVKKERKRPRLDGSVMDGRIISGGRGLTSAGAARHKEEGNIGLSGNSGSGLILAPRSLFDRPTPALAKLRQELRLQRLRGISRPSAAANAVHAAAAAQSAAAAASAAGSSLIKPQLPVKPLPEPEHVPDWVIHEDYTILQAVQQVQEMTLNLIVLNPGHSPNWDLVADMVNMTSRTYRSPKQCKNRYESVIIPREEGKLVLDSPKKQKKNKTIYKPPQMKGGRPLRTAQLFQQDNNSSMTQIMNSRFDAIRSVSNHRAPTVKPLLVDPAMKNPKHAEVLAESHIDYEAPLTPIEVAANRADRLAKEKIAQQAGVSGSEAVAVLRQQQQQQLQNLVKQGAAVASSGTAGTTGIPHTTAVRQLPSMTVQEMVVSGVGGGRTAQVLTAVAASGLGQAKQTIAIQPSAPATSSAGLQSIVQQPSSPASGAVASSAAAVTALQTQAKTGTKTISAAQLALYRQQQEVLRQQQEVLRQQQQLKLLARNQQAGGVTPAPTKVSIAVTAPNTAPSPRIQQVKSGCRPVTESEMVALLKRQQAAKVVQPSASSSTLTTAQILTGIQVKALNSSGKTVSAQQMRQLSLQQHLLAAAVAQQRGTKLSQQKVTQIRQVAGKAAAAVAAATAGGGTQLIVQSAPKSIPTTMTVQQIQQVMKQVQPQHVVVTGGAGRVDGARLAGSLKATTGPSGTGQPTILTQLSLQQPLTVASARPQQAVRVHHPVVTATQQQTVSGATTTLITIPTTSSTPIVAATSGPGVVQQQHIVTTVAGTSTPSPVDTTIMEYFNKFK